MKHTKLAKRQNKRLCLAIGFVGIIAIVICGWYMWSRPQTPPSPQSSDAARFKTAYSRVANDNRFVFASAGEVLEKFESGSGLIFLGFQQCPWCQQLAPIVDEAAKAEGLDKIYYLDIRHARETNDATYKKLVEKLKPHLRTDENGQPRVYVPDVTALKDGRVVGHFLQETTADGEKATPDTYWTRERRARAVERLRQMIRAMR
jgi:rhodanese domain protein